MLAQESTAQKDKEIIISIVKEMTESMTGAQSTRHWAEDAPWFDIPPFASRGIQPALKCFVFVYQPERLLKSSFLRISLDKRDGFGYLRVGCDQLAGPAQTSSLRVSSLFRNESWIGRSRKTRDCGKKTSG